MDESWRLHMGKPNLLRRRSTDATARYDACDFSDVFGGPPRTISGRKFSTEFTTPTSFYEEIFRQPRSNAPANKSGRSLHAFSIPAKSEFFYRDIFGNDQQDWIRRSSKGKSSSSSTSTEELRPLRPMIFEDVTLGSFASKLRPINVPGRWSSSNKRHASPKTASSWRSTPVNDSDLDSPSALSGFHHHSHDDDEEVKSSYVIEVSSDHYKEGKDDAIDEAVAWAKQKFGQHMTPTNHFSDHVDDKFKTDAKEQSEDDRESRMLEEDGEAELWSSAT